MEYRSFNGNMPSSKDAKKSSGKDEKTAVEIKESEPKPKGKAMLTTVPDKDGNFRTLQNAQVGDILTCTHCGIETEYKNGVNQDLFDHVDSHNPK